MALSGSGLGSRVFKRPEAYQRDNLAKARQMQDPFNCFQVSIPITKRNFEKGSLTQTLPVCAAVTCKFHLFGDAFFGSEIMDSLHAARERRAIIVNDHITSQGQLWGTASATQ